MNAEQPFVDLTVALGHKEHEDGQGLVEYITDPCFRVDPFGLGANGATRPAE